MPDQAPRVAVVTGAARGIGAATAKRLAADGLSVAVLDLKEGDCQDTVDAITGAGGQALAVGCDVSQAGQVAGAVAAVAERLGPPVVLVNNAGVTRDNMLFKMTDDDWGAVIDTHLKGSFHAARAAQQHMVARKSGKIVFISSTSALGNRGQTNYSTAKAGLQGMTKTLAIELGPFNVNVNCVAPGFIETAMTKQTAERMGVPFDQFKEAVSAQTPLRRVGTPEDVAGTIAFLCSDDAAYVSGQVIYVAGGPRN